MGIGDYPAEYNPKVHGPYDPARYYGTPDKPFGQLKLGEVTIFFSRYFNLTTHPGSDEHVPCLQPYNLCVRFIYFLDVPYPSIMVLLSDNNQLYADRSLTVV